MAIESNKKLLLLYIWEILKEYSDESHYLTHREIVSKIEQIYGMKCERKAIGANIDALIDFGIDINKVPRKGCYLGQRELEVSEVSYIIDAIFSSRAINGKHSKELAEKISKVLSKYQRRNYKYIYKSEEINRSDKYDLFLNIEILQEAIEKQKKVTFAYHRLPNNSEFANKRYVVNPYFLMNSQGRYYLICSNNNFNEISTYKMDLISDAKITEDEIKPINSLAGHENGLDIAKYINEHIYAFGKETVNAKLKLAGEYAITFVIEWFGKDSRIFRKESDIFAEVKSNEQALIYWCLQYCDHIKLISPVETRNKIEEKLLGALKNYRGEN